MFEIVCNPMESCLKPFVKKRCLKIIGDLQVDIVVAAMTMTSEREEVTRNLFFLLFSILCFERKLTHVICSVFLCS